MPGEQITASELGGTKLSNISVSIGLESEIHPTYITLVYSLVHICTFGRQIMDTYW